MLLSAGAVLAAACLSGPAPAGAQETPKPQPEPPRPEQPAPQPAPVPTGEKQPDGLAFKLAFDRGEGSLRFSRQNGLLRVDVHTRLPYYAGDAQRDRGSLLDLALSVDGLNGRHLIFYPAPIWQPGPEPTPCRSEATFSKTGGFTRLTEQPSFAGLGDVKYWDEWKATLLIDLRLVVVTGSTPASVADNWRASLVVGNSAAREAFPDGVDEMNPGLTPTRMFSFKFSDLPQRPDLDEDPREAAIAAEKAMHDAMRGLTALAVARDFAGLQKKTQELAGTYKSALWPSFLNYLIARVAYENGLEGLNADFLPLMKTYLEACPGQSQVHLDYLNALLGMGKAAESATHFAELLASPLCKGNRSTEVMLSVRHGANLVRHGQQAEADAIIQKWEKDELLTRDKDLRAMYDALVKAAAASRAQWEEELKFRQADAAKTNPRLTVDTTQGKFVIELFEDDAPNTVASMVALAQAKFYDGLTFHRFVQNFVIQGGCPKGDGTGDPGYRLKSEVNKRNHFRGMVGMACTGPRTNTEGSQFYVCLSDGASVKNLSGQYVIVGRVIEGMEVVDKLRAGDKMKTVTAGNLRDHAYVPEKIKD